MRLLLIIPPGNYPRALPCFDLIPQGPAYISGTLKAHGHDVRGVCIAYDTSGDPAPIVLRRALAQAVEEHQPQVIAVGAMAAEFLFLRDVIAYCRELAPDVPVLCGGSIMTNDRQAMELLRPDFIIMDEGEHAIVEFLQTLEAGDSMTDVLGVGYWDGKEAVFNPLRTAISDLDALPFPDYEAQDIHTYFELSNQTDNYFHVRTQARPRMLPLSSGRSCPFRCTFCQYATVGGSRRKYRGRTMASVIEEIVHLDEKYSPNIIKIYDDLFSVRQERILEFCERLNATKLKIAWNASMRVGDVNPKLLAAMKDAGCIHIGYGFESASDPVLYNMNKRITQKQIAAAIEMTEAAGIGVQANFIFGDPAETEQTVAETIDFYEEHCLDHIVHNDYITPYPGSPIFDHSTDTGAITDKQTYYETIHLRPRYNMTKMRDQTFYAAVEPIVRKKLAGAKFAKDVELSVPSPSPLEHDYFSDSLVVQAQAVCPHCGEHNAYLFPKQGVDPARDDARYRLLEPVRYYCGHCHKRLLVPLLSLIDEEASLRRFIDYANRWADSQTPIIVAPLVGEEVLDTCRAWGLRFDELNVHSVYSRHPAPNGAEYLGHRVFELTEANIARYKSLDVLLLPVGSESKTTQTLLEAGLSASNIVSWDRCRREPSLQAAPPVLPKAARRLKIAVQR